MKSHKRNETGPAASRRPGMRGVVGGLVSVGVIAGLASLSAMADATEPAPAVAGASSLPFESVVNTTVIGLDDATPAGPLSAPRPDLYPLVSGAAGQGMWGLQFGFDHPNPALRGAVSAMTRVSGFGDGEGASVTVSLEDPRPAMALYGPVMEATIDGASGWAASDGSRVIIGWQVSNVTWASATLVGTLDQALEFANGVSFVTESEWAAHYSVPQPHFATAADELAIQEMSEVSVTTVQVP